MSSKTKKPFNPPRPSSTGFKPSKATFSSTSGVGGAANRVTKSKAKTSGKGKGTVVEDVGRGRERIHLPSLSPDSSDEGGREEDVEEEDEEMLDEQDEEEDDEEDDEEEEEASAGRRKSIQNSKSTHRRRSGTLDHQRSPTPSDPDASDPSQRQQQIQTSKAKIPPNLLSVILQTHFADQATRRQGGGGSGKATRITLDASKAVAKYVDVFVREAVARAEWLDRGGEEDEFAVGSNAGGAGSSGKGVLEVEALERLGAQLLLDF